MRRAKWGEEGSRFVPDKATHCHRGVPITAHPCKLFVLFNTVGVDVPDDRNAVGQLRTDAGMPKIMVGKVDTRGQILQVADQRPPPDPQGRVVRPGSSCYRHIRGHRQRLTVVEVGTGPENMGRDVLAIQVAHQVHDPSRYPTYRALRKPYDNLKLHAVNLLSVRLLVGKGFDGDRIKLGCVPAAPGWVCAGGTALLLQHDCGLIAVGFRRNGHHPKVISPMPAQELNVIVHDRFRTVDRQHSKVGSLEVELFLHLAE